MIKRILNPQEFKILLDDIFPLFDMENEKQGHALLKHNKEYIFNAFGDKSILAWDFFVWGNINDEGKFDAVIAFLNNKNEKFGEEIFAEYIWLSKNPRVGQKLLGTAMKFAREKEFKYAMMSCVEAHPKARKVARFYEKMGFIKDSETYIAKL
jgi:DNA modification methylase